MTEKKEVKRINPIFRLIDSTKIYNHFQKYIDYPKFDDLVKGTSKYSEKQFKFIQSKLTFLSSKAKALDECEEVIKYLNEEGFKTYNYLYFEVDLIETIKETRTRDVLQLLKIDNYTDNVKALWKIKPFFYDKAKIYWFWDTEEFCWKMLDETDILLMIDKELSFGGQLVTGKIKNNYLEAIKQVGRSNIPKEAPKEFIQFKDTIFNLKTGQTSKASPEYFMCNPIPHSLGETDETPVMDELIISWVGEEYLKTIYEMIAYCCLTDYPMHLMFCLVGNGRNGKSQLQKVIQNFMGMDNICSTELDLLIDNRFESAKMFKKLVCTLGETNFGVMKKTSLLKKLSGGDLIGYEFKNKNPFDGYNYAKIIINSNSLPTSMDTSDGFYRRWFIIDFPNEFPEGKDIISTIPNHEYNNLARKIITILPELISKGKFHNQGSIEERKRAYIMASNPLPYFISNVCKTGDREFIKSNDLYKAYIRYLNANKKRKIKRKEFSEILNEEGLFIQKQGKKINEFDYVNTFFVDGIDLKKGWEKLLIPKNKLKPIKKMDKMDKMDSFTTSFSHRETNSKYCPKSPKSPKTKIPPKFYEKEVIEPPEIRFHIEQFGENGAMNIEQLKDDLKLSDTDIDNLLKNGTFHQSPAGWIRIT